MCAVYPDARNPFAYPELLEQGLEPWTVDEIWLSGHPSAADVVDVTQFVPRKFEALLSHMSQHPEPDVMQSRVSQWMQMTAVANGLPEDRFAEAFRVVRAG
jgi:hypothetical protein